MNWLLTCFLSSTIIGTIGGIALLGTSYDPGNLFKGVPTVHAAPRIPTKNATAQAPVAVKWLVLQLSAGAVDDPETGREVVSDIDIQGTSADCTTPKVTQFFRRQQLSSSVSAKAAIASSRIMVCIPIADPFYLSDIDDRSPRFTQDLLPIADGAEDSAPTSKMTSMTVSSKAGTFEVLTGASAFSSCRDSECSALSTHSSTALQVTRGPASNQLTLPAMSRFGPSMVSLEKE